MLWEAVGWQLARGVWNYYGVEQLLGRLYRRTVLGALSRTRSWDILFCLRPLKPSRFYGMGWAGTASWLLRALKAGWGAVAPGWLLRLLRDGARLRRLAVAAVAAAAVCWLGRWWWRWLHSEANCIREETRTWRERAATSHIRAADSCRKGLSRKGLANVGWKRFSP